MTAAIWCAAVLAFFALSGLAIVSMLRHERRWRDERPTWWKRPIDGPGLRMSVRPCGDPAAAEVISISDPRVVSATVSKRRTRKAVSP